MHFSRSSSNVLTLPSFLDLLQNVHVLLSFGKVQNPLRLPRKATSKRPTVIRTNGALNMLTSKCALRHKGVHFFDLSTSKRGPTLMCLIRVYFETRFAPQRRGLFRHLSFEKWYKHVCVSYIFHFNMCFDVSTSKSGPNMVCFVYLTSKCASRHNGVQLFISHPTSWLRTCCLSEPPFRPSGATIHWKNTVFRDFFTFSRTWIFFLFSSLFPSLLFICAYSRKLGNLFGRLHLEQHTLASPR